MVSGVCFPVHGMMLHVLFVALVGKSVPWGLPRTVILQVRIVFCAGVELHTVMGSLGVSSMC